MSRQDFRIGKVELSYLGVLSFYRKELLLVCLCFGAKMFCFAYILEQKRVCFAYVLQQIRIFVFENQIGIICLNVMR